MLLVIFLVVMLAMLIAATIVGRSIAKLLPYRLRPIGRLYFSPLFGVGLFVLIATVNGWIAPFNQWISLLELFLVLSISLFFLRKDLKWSPFLRYSMFLFVFSLLASVAISSSLIRFNAYNSFDDTFTYLVHGQWLQKHAFSQIVKSSGFYPALSQISLYQGAGARMGGSFFLGWLQSIFGIEWSYSVYPAAIAVPFVAGSLAIGGAVNLVVRGSRKIAFLSGLVAATTFSGLTFGVTNGFFPQTFGLAFALGATSLFAALINESCRIKRFKRLFIGAIPVSILFAALVFSYNDMLPFVGIALIGFLILVFVFDRFNVKAALLSGVVVFFQTLIIINVEFARVLKNFVSIILGVGAGKYAVGYPILWHPFEFLAFSFGFRTAYADYWIFGKYITPVIFIALFLSIFYYIGLTFRNKLSNSLLVCISILFFYFLTFLYFRYGSKSITLNEIGHTFLQFKMAKWASPFAFVLMGSAIAFYSKKYRTKVLLGFLGFLVLFGAFVHLDFSKSVTNGFRSETGYDRSSFNAFLHLREKIKSIDNDKVIYLNLGSEHHKLRQMIAYILYDRKLASDYTDDGYILGQLPPKQQKMPVDMADWVIEFAGPNENSPNAGMGNIVLKKASEIMGFTQTAVSGGYSRETDGTNWWYWTPRSLAFEYKALTSKVKAKKPILKFTYLPATSGNLQIKVDGKELTKFKMAGGWQEYVSKPIEVNSEKLLVELISDGKPVRTSDADPRMVSFLVQNLELVKVK